MDFGKLYIVDFEHMVPPNLNWVIPSDRSNTASPTKKDRGQSEEWQRLIELALRLLMPDQTHRFRNPRRGMYFGFGRKN